MDSPTPIAIPPFECERCGYTTARKDNLLAHLKRKRPCSPSKRDVPVSEYIQRLRERSCRTAPSSEGYTCTICQASFKNAMAKSRHQNACKFEQDTKTSEIERLKQRIQLLEQQTPTTTNTYNTTNNNTTTTNILNNHITQNQHIHIRICPFGQENTRYLIEEGILKTILEEGKQQWQEVLRQIHFNQEHPENMNVYINNLQGQFAVVHDGTHFTMAEKRETLCQLSRKITRLIDENYKELGLSPTRQGRIERLLEDVAALRRVQIQLQNKLATVCYNKRDMAIENAKALEEGGMENEDDDEGELEDHDEF